jgi:hypothetical protein
LSLRDRANVEGRWQCPIFVKSETASAPSGLLDRARPVDHGVRIIPVGLVGHTYRLGNMFGDRQEAARKLHHAYLDGRSQQGLAQARAPSVDWLLLPQAYRVASRRAVDHLPIKLLSAGYRLSGYPLSTAPEQDVAADPTRVDTLARLEHRSWEIERILAGWRAGPVRDDRRQINDAIGIDYDELDETLGRPLREYDRVQIRVAAAMLAAEAGPVTVRPEITIGLLGGPRVSEAQVAAIEATCDREVPALLAANRGAAVTVLTSLNPGAELILAERIRGMLVASDVEHRLVVVQTLPREILMDTCPPDLERRVDTLIGSWGEVALANLLPVACTMADWQDPHARAEATRRARAYVVSRAAVVVAVAVPEGEVDRTGVREATGWASGAAAIPPAYAALLAPEPRSPPRTIIVGSAP